MEEEGKEKEEIIPKKISKIELDELNRLHITVVQAPNRVIGTVNLLDQAKKNVFDYHLELSKKYKFNPFRIGINRHTGDLQQLPKDAVNPNKNKKNKVNKNDIKKMLKKAMEEKKKNE